jgi:hypothetical protein
MFLRIFLYRNELCRRQYEYKRAQVFNIVVRGMGFEPMQPYGNRSLRTSLNTGNVLLSLSPMAKLGHPREARRVQMLNQHLLLYLFGLPRMTPCFDLPKSYIFLGVYDSLTATQREAEHYEEKIR